MEMLTQLLDQHGMLLLFGLGFLEFIGAPIAGIPVLIVAGGLAAMGGIPVPLIVVAAALGGLVADLVWYTLARVRGRRLVDTVCGLTSNPNACALIVEQKVARVGAWYLLPAKFVPGAGNLVAAVSGFVPVSIGAFLLADALGLLAWASIFTGLGWAFSHQVEMVIQWASQLGVWLLAAGAVVILGGVAVRLASVRKHRKMHPPGLVEALEPDEEEAEGYELVT